MAEATKVTTVPIVVAARNEEACIGDCLDALLAAVDYAEARLEGVRFDVHVVLDDCTDRTGAIARARPRVRTSACSGGKVEAQRLGVRAAPGDMHVFVDADVLLDEDTLHALLVAMHADAHLRVAFPRKEPLRPRRTTRLARALYVYNKERGFSRARTWFNGKTFAMRGWAIPDAREVRRRAASLPRDRFYALDEPLRVDDVYLSRLVLLESGPAALREVGGCVRFRAPETLRGMYRYYRRMRRELERTDLLFPETREAHARWGTREPTELAAAPPDARRAYRDFRAALAICRVAYVIERAYARHVAPRARSTWPAIAETKVGLRDGTSTRG